MYTGHVLEVEGVGERGEHISNQILSDRRKEQIGGAGGRGVKIWTRFRKDGSFAV